MAWWVEGVAEKESFAAPTRPGDFIHEMMLSTVHGPFAGCRDVWRVCVAYVKYMESSDEPADQSTTHSILFRTSEAEKTQKREKYPDSYTA